MVENSGDTVNILSNNQSFLQKSSATQETSSMTSTPKYVIKYRYEQRDLPLQCGNADPCRPTSMVVEISLPEMSSAKG